jgi:DNA topoisomerase-1
MARIASETQEKQDQRSCAVCGMKIIDQEIDLRAVHLDAYRRVKEAYPIWSTAYGHITTAEFLNHLISLPETGELAREIARFLTRNPERWREIRTLVVCEKPDAAQRLARALDEENLPQKRESQGVPYFECHTREGPLTICSALGHLYGVDSKGHSSRGSYPIWDYRWFPKHLADKEYARLARWVRAIESLAAHADRFVNACDYDIEGSVIGHAILQYACGQANGATLRMKFSTMTERELRAAFRKLESNSEITLVEAGKCRHELDWLYGINLSRLLSESNLKQGRGYTTLSTGRVQGPTLGFVVEKEAEISCFVPTPFWTINATIDHAGKIYPLEYEKNKVASQSEAKMVCDDCRAALLELKNIESREIHLDPPFPFDLSTLQSEGYRHLGLSPARTLALAEKLYLDALISYPRTSSQKLPPDIGYAQILRGVSSNQDYRSLAGKLLSGSGLRPRNGPRDDPAHPAIYPTGESPRNSLAGPAARLYDLVVRRFMATFAYSSTKRTARLILEHDIHQFSITGSKIIKLGWIEFYRPYVFDDSRSLPDMKIGDTARINNIDKQEKFTQPPPRYNPSSLLKKMEEANIGTKATRAGIIDLLYKRNYVKDERMKANDLANSVTQVLMEYCPSIIDPDFTARLETMMEQIQQGTKSRRRVVVEALEHLRGTMLSLVETEQEVGSQLSGVIVAQRSADATFESPCPKCGLGLSIVRNRSTGKRFIGCAGKWETGCSFTLPLPQFGAITLLSRRCNTCGFQMIQARSKGRRPLISCPLCYSRRTGKAGPSVQGSRVLA